MNNIFTKKKLVFAISQKRHKQKQSYIIEPEEIVKTTMLCIECFDGLIVLLFCLLTKRVFKTKKICKSIDKSKKINRIWDRDRTYRW